VLSRGNGTLIAYLAYHLVFLSHSFAMIFIHYKNFKTLKITGFGALAGPIQHMAAQKVRFTPRLLRQVAITGMLQA